MEAGIVVLISEFLLSADASSLALESRSTLGDQFAFRREHLARSISIQSNFSTDSRSFFRDTKDTKIPVLGQFGFPQAALACEDGGMTVGKGKRPSDPNQLAKWIVEQSTGESVASHTPVAVPADLSAYMAAMGRKGGMIGGKRRLVTMTAAQRKKIAAKAAAARWGKKAK
jgi:hypothetical protein